MEDSDGVGVLDWAAGTVDEEESEEVEGGEEEEDVAGHSSLSIPVRGPGPKQYIRPSLED